jgi:predicted adenine nucleotide alpha hydrolase (AANH) superfamily ATPase
VKRMLIHVCCAHCAAYTIEHWRREGWETTGFWYNPNIHPFTEHQQRLESMRALAAKTGTPLIVVEGYDIVEYFRRVAGHEEERCRRCFELRLAKTAETTRERGYDAFTTTLLISPHQKHDLIREMGGKAAGEKGVAFLYADLRKRYSDSRHITKPMELYRQQYCGCIFSEWERFRENQEKEKGASIEAPS